MAHSSLVGARILLFYLIPNSLIPDCQGDLIWTSLYAFTEQGSLSDGKALEASSKGGEEAWMRERIVNFSASCL